MTNDNESSNKDVAKPDWNGEERRKEVRRSGVDPRGMIRFEPDKSDRRSGKERRKDRRSGWDSGTTI
jgi:hypothetical protein